jgi:tetratricopeptide (TPR) repeat protein
MNDIEKPDLFDDFLDEKLSGQPLENFKTQLEVNKAFADEFTIHKDILIGIKQQGRAEKKEHFRRLEEKIRQEELLKDEIPVKARLIRFSWLVPIGVAASVVIAVLIYLYHSHSVSIQKEEILFADYFEPYSNIVHPTKRGSELNLNPEEQAYEAYDNGNYMLAIKRFDKLLLHKGDETILFYKANAQLFIGDTDGAIPVFKDLITRCREFCVQEKWYLALAYLKKKDTLKAIQLFEELKNVQEPYAGDSREILLKLK